MYPRTTAWRDSMKRRFGAVWPLLKPAAEPATEEPPGISRFYSAKTIKNDAKYRFCPICSKPLRKYFCGSGSQVHTPTRIPHQIATENSHKMTLLTI